MASFADALQNKSEFDRRKLITVARNKTSLHLWIIYLGEMRGNH